MLLDMLQVHWFDLLQTIFMVAGFWLTARSFRINNRSQFLGHLMSLNEQNQEIKATVMDNPKLARVFKDLTDKKLNISSQEAFYVRRIINHLYIVFMTKKLSGLSSFKGMEKDIKLFLSHPIPAKIWEEMKPYQENDFIGFVDDLLGD